CCTLDSRISLKFHSWMLRIFDAFLMLFSLFFGRVTEFQHEFINVRQHPRLMDK
ncbi:hypothetical protein ACJX0J_031080, partial [Zea mays]